MAGDGDEGREVLNIRRRMGLSGATLGTRMDNGGGREAREIRAG